MIDVLWRLRKQQQQQQQLLLQQHERAASVDGTGPDGARATEASSFALNGEDACALGGHRRGEPDGRAASAPLPRSGMFHAWDTETIGVDPSEESPVGRGRIICVSAYCGPDVDLGSGPRLWVDNYGDAEGTLDEFRAYFEDPAFLKVWHNYSFDRAVLYNRGIDARGFAGDTMHMARLYDASRMRYSLEALSQDLLSRSKRSMKERFGRPRVLKGGGTGKEVVVPPTDELQSRADTVRDWVDYSTYDAEATWFLRDALEKRLRQMHLRGPTRSMYDLYAETFVPFGELLTDMERVGFKVDIGLLAKAQRVAERDREQFAEQFRRWAGEHCPDATAMNVGSDNQKRQLLFAPARNKRSGEALPAERKFEVTNTDGFIEHGRSKPKKKRPIAIRGLGLPPVSYTASGWPACSTSVLRKLAGEPREDPPRHGLAHAFLAERFRPGADAEQKAREACLAIDSLVEAGSVSTLLDNFIEPLQTIVDANHRVHASLNLNTETGRLSARRPNLQNQPALEKDRYRVREAFTCEPGNLLVVADYGQLELRLLAHISKCRSMVDAFASGGDFHSRTAAAMYPHIGDAVRKGEVLLESDASASAVGGGERAARPSTPLVKDVFSTERRRAKTLNFSIAYGKTPAGLARDWGTSIKEARGTVEAWYADRPEVRAWQRKAIQHAHKKGYVKTLLGRRRPLRDIHASSSQAVRHAERAAINTPLQGSAADVVMKAMLRIHGNDRLRKLGWRMILQVHDEIVLEGPAESVHEVQALVEQLMARPFREPLLVDLAVSASHARTWFGAKC